MKSILFLTENYYPRVSGVPVVVQYLAEGLIERGYNVSVCTKWYEGLPNKENINGVYIYRFRLYKTLTKRYVGEIDAYRKFVLSLDADVVIFECSECVTTDVLLRNLTQLRGKKIFHSHGFAGMRLLPFRWNVNFKYTLGNTYNWLRFKIYYTFIFKKYIKEFDETMCLSEMDSSKTWLEKNARRVTILQNSVDEMFCQSSDFISYDPIVKLSKPYLLCVCTYSKQKNQIGILREYFKSGVEESLVFVGPEKTEYYYLLQKEIDKLKATYGERDILTLVQVPRMYIPEIMAHAVLYLVGSNFEEYSISLIETMAKGVPFISTNVGNARILPGGITVDSISDMHKKIVFLLRDKEERMRLGELGKQFVQENCRRYKAITLLETVINR